MTFAIYITEMRRYYFIWYEKKLKEKGISWTTYAFANYLMYNFIIFLRFLLSDWSKLPQLLRTFLLHNERSNLQYIVL